MSDWLPSLNALRAFETVSRHLNYRLAAEELCVSPAAVKQLVGKLEASLGSPLLERNGRGLALTAQGIAGRDGLALGFRQIVASVEKMRTLSRRQRLIVSVEPSFATAWLVPRLDLFRARNPEVDVLIDSSLQLVDLQQGAADIAIRFGGRPTDGLVTERLFDEELCAFCSPALTTGRSAIRRLEHLERVTLLHWDLSQLQWASSTKKWMGWKPWLKHLGASHIVPGPGIRFSDYNLAMQAAIAGQGVILGSMPILRSLVEARLLVNPFPDKVTTDVGYDLVTTERAKGRPEVFSFIDWILREAKS
jgi:LysR family transcriptional regulator, glycine cleavage system transcriptional activator